MILCVCLIRLKALETAQGTFQMNRSTFSVWILDLQKFFLPKLGFIPEIIFSYQAGRYHLLDI
jgi:hypothetical protein